MIKQRLFKVMDIMYTTQVVTPMIYYILVFIEFVQLLYYSIYQSFLFKTDFFKYFREVVSYFQPVHYLKIVEIGVFTTFVTFSIVYILICAGLLLYLLTSEKSMLFQYAMKLFNLMMIFLVTILVIPILSVFVGACKCEMQADCDGAIYFVFLAISIIGLILMVSLISFFEVFLVDFNPFNPIPYASKYPKLNWVELFFKLLLPIYAVADSGGNGEIAFIGILTLLYLMMVILRLKTRQFIDNRINNLKLCQTALLFWFSFVAIVHGIIDTEIDDMGFFYEIICSPLVVYTCYKLNRNPQLSVHTRKEVELEELIQQLLFLIENRDQQAMRMKLEGFVKLHISICMKSALHCPCSVLHLDNLRSDDNEKNHTWYQFVQAIIQHSPERLLTTRIQIVRSYLLYKKLKNRFKALFELTLASKNRVSFQEEFCIYRLQNLIEMEMIDQDKNMEIDVQQIVNFQNYYITFENAIELSVNLHLEYWRELYEDNPDIGKLQQLGSNITSSIDQAELEYEQLVKINNMHLKSLEIFGNFLLHVVNNDIEGSRILDKAEGIAKNLEINKFVDSEKFKYDQNSNTCIMTCSVDMMSLGEVLNCNNEITQLLGYKKQDIIKQNINRIMPKILAGVHDDFIRNFIQTSQSKVLGIERQVFAMDKSGFLVPCSLMIRVLPNLSRGLLIVGFLKKTENTDHYFYIMFDEITHSLLGFSESVNAKFGLPVSLTQGLIDLPISEIAPQLIDSINMQQAFEFTFDTTILESNYQFVQDVSLDEEQSHIAQVKNEQNLLLEENEDHSQIIQEIAIPAVEKSGVNRFRKATVKGMLVEDQEYANAKVKTIQFIEESLDQPQFKTVMESKVVEEVDAQEQAALAADVIASEMSSGISVNEEIRQIKEFKITMGEKTEAINIVRLNKIIIALGIVLIILASLQLSYRSNQNDELLQGQMAISVSYYRASIMADIVFYTRYLDLMAQGIVVYDALYREKLSQQVNLLKTIQYSIIKYRIEMEVKGDYSVNNDVQISILVDNTTQQYNSQLSDAIFQMITSASIIRNATLDSFIQYNSSENTINNVFIILNNGYTILREGSDAVAKSYYDFYINLIAAYLTTFYIILSFAILSLVVSQFILVPIVLKIHNTNNKVMSLFGLLSQKDIKDLADQCEQFKTTYLINALSRQKQGQPQQDGIQGLPEQSVLPNESNLQPQVYLEIDNEPQPSKKIQNIDPKPSATAPLVTLNPQKSAASKQDELDRDNLRYQKLMNSKTSDKFSVIIRFITMMLLFVGYFIMNIILAVSIVDQSVQLYEHQKFSTIRPALLKYVTYMSVEEIVGVNTSRSDVMETLYENERNVLQSLQTSYPPAFRSYIDLYNGFNLDSVCASSYSTDQFTMDPTKCNQIAGGILDKGIRNSIVSLALWAAYTNDVKFLDTDQFRGYIDQIYYIDQAIVYLNAQYASAMTDYVGQEQQIEYVKFSCFIIAIFFIFIFVWKPYNNALSKQIWRTKGMLNMIPFEMIRQQENLKNAFLRGNIIQAVK